MQTNAIGILHDAVPQNSAAMKIFVWPSKYIASPKYPCHLAIDLPVLDFLAYLFKPTIT